MKTHLLDDSSPRPNLRWKIFWIVATVIIIVCVVRLFVIEGSASDAPSSHIGYWTDGEYGTSFFACRSTARVVRTVWAHSDGEYTFDNRNGQELYFIDNDKARIAAQEDADAANACDVDDGGKQ